MRLAICDEQWLFASVLAAALGGRGHDVVLVTDDAAELLDSVARSRVELAVIDFLGGPLTTAQVCRRLKGLQPAPRVVLLVDSRDDEAWDTYDSGRADGLVNKACGLHTLTAAIGAVGRGSRVSEGWLVGGQRRQHTLVETLTTRELEVLHLVVRGLSTQQIAERLGVSRHTIRTHVQQVLRKLDVHGRGKLARAAVAAGLVDVGELATGDHR
ncbi:MULTISPECIES: response regulator transcription factor [Kribbella]|jgi:DNA-binding NarL/FixJ family response regulator|uniref:DNA-binding NarL/FixJ family response regulator n=1 Tax=Kribbella pratensis TaxID=2512112 RepID=A0ABY2FQM5_9ACTN|nr:MULTISPECIES: response regulator transcription factor [Kribbella]TDW95450.1 DNA-binding NarL/FixJ family response regulator [Kribbella pratensis]TDX08458.1 DNA-binding NarL/FixJ family response regulator [Kribbella sp. VKM Ac-2566]